DQGIARGGALAVAQPRVLQGPGRVLGDLDPVAAEPLDHLGCQPPGPPATGPGVVHEQYVQRRPHLDHGAPALEWRGGGRGRAPPTWIGACGRQPAPAILRPPTSWAAGGCWR